MIGKLRSKSEKVVATILEFPGTNQNFQRTTLFIES